MNDDKVTLDGLFDGFYRAINGFAPYGWQRRLVRYVAEKGKWPELLDGPTGSGKRPPSRSMFFSTHSLVNWAYQRISLDGWL